MNGVMNPDTFHLHLDSCYICREQPFGLCSDGANLLVESALDVPACCGLPMIRIDRRTELEVWKCEKCGRARSV